MSTLKDMNTLIARVIAEVLAEQQSKPSSQSSSAPSTQNGTVQVGAPYPGQEGVTRALVFYTGASIGFEESLVQLEKLQADNIMLEYNYNESAKKIIDRYQLANLGIKDISDTYTGGHDMLIMPNITVNTAAKVAYGICDSFASNLVSEFIMLNKPVVIAKDAACPLSQGKKAWFPSMPKGYEQRLLQNLEIIESYGVTMVPIRDLHKAVMQVERGINK